MPPKANKRKTNGNGKGEEKKKKYLHKSDSDSDTPPPSPGNEQPGDFIPDDQPEQGDHHVNPDDQHEPGKQNDQHDDDSWDMEDDVDYEEEDEEDTPPQTTNPPAAHTFLSVPANIKPLAPVQTLTAGSVTQLKNYYDTYKALPEGNQSLILYNQLIAVLGHVSSILYNGMSATAF